MKNELAGEVGAATMKAAPAIGVAAASVSGWGVQEWMYAATTVYVVAQLAYLLWKWVREYQRGSA
ncbi:hypothetical protein JHW38_00300 [Lysobacter enzymogenes]|nr:hypothetical protein JHW38_00300 [Lysobacter enzymogenes]